MKQLLSPLLFICFVAEGCINGHSILIKPLYHIKIDCWNSAVSDKTDYCIYFTNDNYSTTQTLIVDRYKGRLLCAPWDIHGKDTSVLIAIARQFKTYQQCVRYNDSVQRDFDSSSTPLPKSPVDTTPCCIAKQVY